MSRNRVNRDAPGVIIRAYTVKRNIRYNVVRVTSSGKKTAGGVRVEVEDEVVRVVLRLEK
ncbi:uncharacterized protein A1O9_12976 [Exophiala aquamarina CBS 119918]|uniref:Uncharacterized protein n=1 Tax=Exophiala aquamarina CBS 119918 TaxID=1182545 RepID=A0A072P5S6_9EURO|nr:uncharacterized protein A1O9_12976 [Exophiala aquamarina CBS 119918]KEF50970.1 hypothetical protein A1O9_12976 [Exophiala aquamarina CBS 119918]